VPRVAPSPPELDLRLLEGFSFACRPDCGLCCYAEPATTPRERARLVQIEPALEFRFESREYSRIAARSDGGACGLLSQNRCRAHAQRPHPCRAFPVHVHIGERAQASLVLSCPGVPLDPLTGWAGRAPRPEPQGLDAELEAVREEFAESPVELLQADASARLTRELRRRGLDASELARIRTETPQHLPSADPARLADLEPPRTGGPLEEAPLFWDSRLGRVLLALTEEGLYEASAVREEGGITSTLGEFPPPEAPPRLDAAALQLLSGYLAYLAERDQFVWSVLAEGPVSEAGSFEEEFGQTLAAVRAELLIRASVRARLLGETGERLGAEEVGRGIRAMDNDLLDRPTIGSIL
jgi:Fe-S-cluster containining protein